jgi:serine/threonine protein kinase
MNLHRQLEHVNIIKLEEVYENETHFILILEYLEGGSLLESIQKYTFSSEEIQTIVSKLLKSIQYVHSKDIIHRDIKPDNIMFEDINNLSSLKLIDFGLAVSEKS